MSDALERLATALADRYRIGRALGAGGMATVYLAEDLKHDRKVAIKVLKPELAAVLGAERFVQEIKTTAALSHPHILPLFDSGRTGGQADGRTDEFLYYVMPYIQGETIREKLDRETQFGIDEAVRITTEVADALDYARRRGGDRFRFRPSRAGPRRPLPLRARTRRRWKGSKGGRPVWR
jgi:serine/threonine-protein kinase